MDGEEDVEAYKWEEAQNSGGGENVQKTGVAAACRVDFEVIQSAEFEGGEFVTIVAVAEQRFFFKKFPRFVPRGETEARGGIGDGVGFGEKRPGVFVQTHEAILDRRKNGDQ